MCVCIINVYFSHQIKIQHALAMRTSQMMKNGQGVIKQKGIGNRCPG